MRRTIHLCAGRRTARAAHAQKLYHVSGTLDTCLLKSLDDNAAALALLGTKRVGVRMGDLIQYLKQLQLVRVV